MYRKLSCSSRQPPAHLASAALASSWTGGILTSPAFLPHQNHCYRSFYGGGILRPLVDAFVVWGLTNIPQPRWDRTLKKSVGCLEISQHIELSSGRTVESISLGAAVGGSILVNLVGGGTLDFGGIEYQSMIDIANAVGFDNGSFERELTALNDRLQANIKRYLTANPKED